MTAPYPPPATPARSDRTTLWGTMGIVIGLLTCWPLGVVFGVLSMNEARKAGKQTTLGIVAIIASIVGLVFAVTMYYLATR